MNADRVVVRPLAARDSFEVLARLLHACYAPLAAAGMDFSAATQTAADTARGAAEGQCFVAECDGTPVGTITVCGPPSDDDGAAAAAWFDDRDSAHFHQFAVHPDLQGHGVGRLLVEHCERWARQRGYRRMALETAEPAHELRAMYARFGYADVGHAQAPGKRWRSVVMGKALDRSPLREQLLALARYNLWATRRLFEHVDAVADADYRRDVGLVFHSIHGTLNHLLVAEHEVWMRRYAHGESPAAVALDAEIEPERAALRRRLLAGTLAWQPLIESWPDARLEGRLDYRKRDGSAQSLPFAATLAHVFNHGTHHRGQVSAALTQLGRAAPELDLVTMLQQEQPR